MACPDLTVRDARGFLAATEALARAVVSHPATFLAEVPRALALVAVVRDAQDKLLGPRPGARAADFIPLGELCVAARRLVDVTQAATSPDVLDARARVLGALVPRPTLARKIGIGLAFGGVAVISLVALRGIRQTLGGAIGATGRRGPRTGVVELDSIEQVAKPVARLVDAFEPCPIDTLSRPAHARLKLTVPDAATGRDIPVEVEVNPDSQVEYASGEHHLYRNDSDGTRQDYVYLRARRNLCISPGEWKQVLRSILTHELTHVVDPGLAKTRRAPKTLRRHGMCAYLTQPHEVAAYLAQTREDLLSFDATQRADKLRRAGALRQPADLLRLLVGDRWRKLQGCLRPADQRRFLRLAAQIWETRGYADR